jgi:hypothetical protein
MTRRLITVTTLAATLAAGTLLATPASADNVAFGLSFNVPGLSVGVGTPAYDGFAYGAAAYGGARTRARYGYAPTAALQTAVSPLRAGGLSPAGNCLPGARGGPAALSSLRRALSAALRGAVLRRVLSARRDYER